jgi:hypothetical protein
MAGDEVYGGDPGLSAGLERRRAGYVLAVADMPSPPKVRQSRKCDRAERLAVPIESPSRLPETVPPPLTVTVKERSINNMITTGNRARAGRSVDARGALVSRSAVTSSHVVNRRNCMAPSDPDAYTPERDLIGSSVAQCCGRMFFIRSKVTLKSA